MDENNKNVVFEDDAMRQRMSMSYSNNGLNGESKGLNVWVMKHFKFIKNENQANQVLTFFALFIFILSIGIFITNSRSGNQKIDKAEMERRMQMMTPPGENPQ